MTEQNDLRSALERIAKVADEPRKDWSRVVGDIARAALASDTIGSGGGDAVVTPPIVEWIVELARRDIMREQTDFIGRMHQAIGDFETICDEHPGGELDEATRDDVGEALAGLAGLALAQLAMVSDPASPLDCLALPPAAEPVGLREAQEIVAISNRYQGADRDDQATIPIRVLRAAAGIVNGVAFAPLVNRMALATPARTDEAAQAGGDAADFYYPIEMPLNEEGNGPATIGKDAATMTYQVWDKFCDSHGSFEHLADAIRESKRLNAIRALPTQDVDLPIVGEVDHWMLAQAVETGWELHRTITAKIEASIARHGVPYANMEGTADDADDIIAALTQAACPTGTGEE